LAEYRLDELARISGVSPRNIRAYRERGLLDPPRRQGRSAYYDDYHLSQLKTINQLLRKRFNSAHIAEFFARMREGHDLAAILGVQQAILGPRAEDRRTAAALDLDPGCDEVRRLVSCGLANRTGETVSLVHPEIAEVVMRSADQLHYIRMILRVFDCIEELAATLISALQDAIETRYGSDYIQNPGEMADMAQLVQDYRDLASAVFARHLDKALQQQIQSAVSEYTPMAGGAGPQHHQRLRS
jgi:DNA-binding transcriptional MerR regulator